MPFAGRSARASGAPTVPQEHYASSSTIGVRLTPTGPLVLYPVRTLPVDSPAAIALGAKPLVPEKSTSYSVGFVLQPLRLLNVTWICTTSRSRPHSAHRHLAGNGSEQCTGREWPGPESGRPYFTNAADTTTRGVDVVTTYRTDFGSAGRVDWSFSGNYNKTNSTAWKRHHPNSPPLAWY